MTKENMRLIKEGLTFSEAIEHIQSGEEGFFIRRDAPIWGDSFIGLFPESDLIQKNSFRRQRNNR